MSVEGVTPRPYWTAPTGPPPTSSPAQPGLVEQQDSYAEQHSQVFFDPRSGDRVLRVTWHPESELVVLSLWRDGTCVGTFRLNREAVTPFVQTLLDGLSEPIDRSVPHDSGIASTGQVDAQLRQAASPRPPQNPYSPAPQVTYLPDSPGYDQMSAPTTSRAAAVDVDASTQRRSPHTPSHRAATTPPPAYAMPDEPPPPPAEPEGGESLSDWIFAGNDRDAG